MYSVYVYRLLLTCKWMLALSWPATALKCTLYIYASVKRLTSLKKTVKGDLFLKFDVSQYKPAVIIKSDKNSSSP